MISATRQRPERRHLPPSDRPIQEQEEALDFLVESYQGSVRRAAEDFQFLVRTRPLEKLDQAARLLVDFSQRLETRAGGRRALLEYARRGCDELALFQAALGAQGSVDGAAEWWESLRDTTGLDADQKLDLVELAELGDVRLLQALRGQPPSPAVLDSLKTVLERSRGPALVSDDFRPLDGVWHSEATYYRLDLDCEPLDLRQVFEPRFECLFAADDDLEIRGPGQVRRESDKLLMSLPSGPDTSLELRFLPRGEHRFNFSQPRIVGYKARPLSGMRMLPEGDWGELPGDGFHLTWADSPERDYSPGQNASLTSNPIELSQERPTALSFDIRYRLQRHYDFCYLELQDEAGEWHELDQFTSSGDKEGNFVSLEDWQGQTIRFRFRFQSNERHQKEGVEISNLQLLERTDEEIEIPLLMRPEEELARDRLITTFLELDEAERLEALQVWERVGGRVQSTQAALDFWQLRDPQADPEVQEEAFLLLESSYPREGGELFSMLEGDELLDQAHLLKAVGRARFPSYRKLLQQSETPYDFLLTLVDHELEDQAPEILAALRLPFGDEQPHRRRELYLKLMEAVGSHSLTCWTRLTRWVPGEETLEEALQAFLILHDLVDGDQEALLRTWRRLQDGQMDGTIPVPTLSECVRRLGQAVVEGSGELEDLLPLLGQTQTEMELVEEADLIIIGGSPLQRQD